jgi:hypothetical protein
MWNRDWGVRATVPLVHRYFNTTDDTTGNLESFEHTRLGDIRISGVYTGLSPDMSTGLTFGVKLPNGDYKAAGFDRDTAIGTGSTDLLLGLYRMGWLKSVEGLAWFASGQWDQPVLIKDHYRPGTEVNVATGVYYEGTRKTGDFHVTPLLQLVGTWRDRDGGAEAEPDETGYTRLLISPGIEVDYGQTSFHADVGLPVYQDVNADQLTAPVLFKFSISRRF